MSASRELIDTIQAMSEGTPYVVEETPDGFDVRLDIADARWYSLIYEEGIKQTFIQHVALDEAKKSLSITDDCYEVTWQVDPDLSEPSTAPVLYKSDERTAGRAYELGARKEFAWNTHGQYADVLDFRLTENEGRNLIRTASEELGWDENVPGAATAGLVFGAAGGGFALMVLIALLVGLLLGKF